MVQPHDFVSVVTVRVAVVSLCDGAAQQQHLADASLFGVVSQCIAGDAEPVGAATATDGRTGVPPKKVASIPRSSTQVVARRVCTSIPYGGIIPYSFRPANMEQNGNYSGDRSRPEILSSFVSVSRTVIFS